MNMNSLQWMGGVRRSLRLAGACALLLAAPFTLRAQDARIDLTTLDGGGSYRPGEPVDIVWSTAGDVQGPLRLSLWDGSQCRWIPVVESIPAAAGHFQWRLPADLKGDRFRLRVESLADRKLYHMSASFFEVDGAPVTAVSGVREERSAASNLSVRVSPNPATKNIVVSVAGGGEGICVLRNNLGDIVRRQQMAEGASVTFATDDLPAGIYFAEVRLEKGGYAVEKVVIGR